MFDYRTTRGFLMKQSMVVSTEQEHTFLTLYNCYLAQNKDRYLFDIPQNKFKSTDGGSWNNYKYVNKMLVWKCLEWRHVYQ